MDQELRNRLRNVVMQCRKLLEESISQELEGKYAIFAKKDQVTTDPNAPMTHLSDEEQSARKDILDHFNHIQARGFKPKDALDQLIREIAFTHLNRLCAYKMMEAREVYIGEYKFRDAVGNGVNSKAVMFYLADHPEDERLFNTGHQDIAYRHFLDWLGALLSDEIGVLFSPNDPANRLYPKQKTLDEVLDLLNGGGIKPDETELREKWPQLWSQDETIGWVYQYFTPKDLRDQARKESQAPRNSYELAFRNQFFTPRYVVEFLTDNTLGRIWFEMQKGQTKLTDQCRYLVRRPKEIFLHDGELPPKDAEGGDRLSQEGLLKLPVHIPHRPKRDPRDLKILDPACGSGHFLLYCFDLLISIYEEAYADPQLGPALTEDYPTLDALRRDIPRLILANNIHGIDIDLRCSQIAALALWLRCQRAYQEMGLRKERPKITRSNFVCAEPMPGEEPMLKEFVSQLEPKLLGHVVEVVFDKMKLAGEAGSLLKIEEDIREAVVAAKKQWARETTQATDRKGQPLLFSQAAMDRLTAKPDQPTLFDLTDLTDDQFFEQAEAKVVEALRSYAEKAQNGRNLQRRLFAEDTVRGFGFVDVCHKRFDVVLMNPPFGLCQKHLTDYNWRSYPDTYVDLLGCFVTRGLQLAPTGLVGAITSRSFLVVKKLLRWRKHEVIPTLSLLLDLGEGVMDDAYVESCAYVLGHATSTEVIAIDRRHTTASDRTLPTADNSTGINYCVPREMFLHLPEYKLLYSSPSAIANLLKHSSPVFEPEIGTAREGMRTFDNFRFLRLRWEVDPTAISPGSIWEPMSKGGDYALYYADIHLLVKWNRDGAELAEENRRVNGQVAQSRQASAYYRRPGATYSIRSAKGFSARALPAGCIFGHVGPAILSESEISPEYLVGWLNSRLIVYLVHLQACFGKFNTGVIKQMPWRVPENADLLGAKTKGAIESLRLVSAHDEVASCFVSPPLGESLQAALDQLVKRIADAEAERNASAASWDEAIDKCYGVNSSNLELETEYDDDTEAEERNEDDGVPVGLADLAHRTISYAVGVAFGRWDCAAALTDVGWMSLPDPFASLPACPPGMLKDSNGLPAVESPIEYPVDICWDGVFCDDADNSDDIVHRVGNVFEVIWKDGADQVE
ncbi:MAG: BREX-1 system adenine-specific DNA-methyltransferase PglX [Bryobacterales bacterium]|nr:BREX-1 system adenine-specific DNA-methyltransferase PglX [Bryobacterales bacterium]